MTSYELFFLFVKDVIVNDLLLGLINMAEFEKIWFEKNFN